MAKTRAKLPDIATIQADFPDVIFKPHDQFYWSASQNTVFFVPKELTTGNGISHLLHELGHALCEHTSFTSGIGLLRLECEAWDKAAQLAKRYGTTISEKLRDYCLNSYRDWLHVRSTCPTCQAHGVEKEVNRYRCFNCQTEWSVPADQRTRNYRQTLKERPV